jgi:hypothetical protein
MEAVIHARGQAQRRVLAFLVVAHQLRIAQQIEQRVRESLRLQHGTLPHPPAGADQRIAGADQNMRVRIDGAYAVLEFADEAIVQAFEVRLFCLAQIKIGEQPPQGDARAAHPGVLDPAQPAHELRQ